MTRTRAAGAVQSAALSATLALGLAPAVSAQAPQGPTFRTSTTLVEVSAIVTDKDGRTVTDLAPNEIEVLDNGVPQALVEGRPACSSLDAADPISARRRARTSACRGRA